MKRRVICYFEWHRQLHALCDDGSVWFLYYPPMAPGDFYAPPPPPAWRAMPDWLPPIPPP